MQSLFVLLAFAAVALVQADRDWSKITPLDINRFGLKDAVPGNSRIVGGDEATPHSFPHQAALFVNLGQKTAFCGGSILSSKFILTAAHCVDKTNKVEVVVGAHKIREEEATQQRIVATKFYVHHDWSMSTLQGDIAIIELSEEIQFNENVQPIRLPSYSDTDAVLTGKAVTASGWGKDSDKATAISPILRYVNSKIISPLMCKLFFFGVPGENHICTSGNGKVGVCNGDSGGALIGQESDSKNTQLGIASFVLGLGCEIGWPSAFTKVSSYLPWINEITNLPIRA